MFCGLQVILYSTDTVEFAVMTGDDQCLWLPFDASDAAETLPQHVVAGGYDATGRYIVLSVNYLYSR